MRTPRAQRGFTLIEILIVVLLLGVLSAIVIPQFTDLSEESNHSNVAGQLHTLRSQIQIFNAQRPDPGFGTYGPTTPLANFWDGLVNNNYIYHEPRNPYQDPATDTAVGAVPAIDVGWVWDGSDLIATDGNGAPFPE